MSDTQNGHKPKHKRRGAHHKYRCADCGFTAKGIGTDSPDACPNCDSTNIEEFHSSFRFSKKKRKNPLRIKTKNLNKLMNGQKKEISRWDVKGAKPNLKKKRKENPYRVWEDVEGSE